MTLNPKKDYGGGLNLSSNKLDNHPSGPPQHGELGQAERAFTLASTFLSGVLAITASQFIGAPLKLIDPEFYDAYMAYTKESFAVLITSLTQWWAPTVVRVSGDESMKGQLTQLKDGSLQCNFSERLVLMANHQLYTDWLYLWWIAYTNKMHGRIYIILKESLKNIPIIGWGCQFYNFIFLSRKWEQDQLRFEEALEPLKKATHPMWLIIFPEGTNLSAGTRAKSKSWAQKNNLQDMKHQLLPRSTGLRFCLQELRQTTPWLYDCTIAYEGVPPGQFGQDIFTLRTSFFEGRPPKSVNMHWRRFPISSIPIDSPKAFDVWLRNRWREKDYLLEYFSRHSRFPATSYWKEHLASSASADDKSISSSSIRSVARPAITIETHIQSGRFEEFLRIFAPITALAMALFLAYGADPDQLPFPNGAEFFGQFLGPLMGQMQLPSNMGDMEKMLEHGPNISAPMAGGPPTVKMGSSPEDKRKQQKYLQLFKESLPKNISLEAEQRKRVSSFVKGLPDSKAARVAAQGVKEGVQGNSKPSSISTARPQPKAQTQTPTSTLRKLPLSSKPPPPLKSATSQPTTSSRTRTTPLSKKPPIKSPSSPAGPSRLSANATSPLPLTPSTPFPARTTPNYATINGVRVQIQSSSAQLPTQTPSAAHLQTKEGVRVKNSSTASTAAANIAKTASRSKGENGVISTKNGVRIRQAGANKDEKSKEHITTKGGVRIKKASEKRVTK